MIRSSIPKALKILNLIFFVVQRKQTTFLNYPYNKCLESTDFYLQGLFDDSQKNNLYLVCFTSTCFYGNNDALRTVRRDRFNC